MKKRIVFKFRDDLYLPFYQKLYGSLHVPRGYRKQLRDAYGRTPRLFGLGLERQIGVFTNLLHDISRDFGEQPSYHFKYTPLHAFNTIKGCLGKIALAKLKAKHLTPLLANKSTYAMPVYYLTFDYQVPENFPEDKLKVLVEKLRTFQKKAQNEGVLSLYLLDYVYLEELPGPPSVVLPRPHSDTLDESDGDQDYFQTMNFPPYPLPFDGSGVGVGVIEKFGWFVGHDEFTTVANQIDIVLNANLLNPNNWRTELTRSTLANMHGTNTLGVLISPHDPVPNVPDCKGILPPNARTILSSYSVAPKPPGTTLSDPIYSIDDATANLLLLFCNEYQYGQVIAIELAVPLGSNGVHYPYIVAPGFASLVKCAYELGHLVVVPAGNLGGGKNISEHIAALPDLERGWYNHTKGSCLLVGAYETPDNKLQVRGTTNWGEGHIDTFAQGENILTTSDLNTKYDRHSDTSGATAIMAGSVALLQAYARNSTLGRALFPLEMLRVLAQSGGKPVVRNMAENGLPSNFMTVGHVPDIGKAMQAIRNMAGIPDLRPNAPVPGPFVQT